MNQSGRMSWEEPWATGNGERGQVAGCGTPEFKFQIWSNSKEIKARFFQGCGVEAEGEDDVGTEGPQEGWLPGRAPEEAQRHC